MNENPAADHLEQQPAKTRPIGRERRVATVREAKALAHPLRVRILRLCTQQELTNKQLADQLDRDPGTVLYHVRQLAEAGFLEPVPVRGREQRRPGEALPLNRTFVVA